VFVAHRFTHDRAHEGRGEHEHRHYPRSLRRPRGRARPPRSRIGPRVARAQRIRLRGLDARQPGLVVFLPSISFSVFPSSDADGAGSEHPSPGAHSHATAHALVIPSLTLPAALRHPTAFGATLGAVRLLVAGRAGVGRSRLAGIPLDGNADVVEVGTWEPVRGGRALRASTFWIEHRDVHGLERFEPARNVRIVELDGFERAHDTT
jgi:hypothetical protein